MAGLSEYRRKRHFKETPEPAGKPEKSAQAIFVVQRHAARRLHYDFRLAVDGVLKSWAVPKGPPLDPSEKRLAIHVEDHPIEYAKFEGDIPQGHYGAGEVRIWDRGTFEPEGDRSASEQIRSGELKFRLHGERLNGSFVLVKLKNSQRQNEWLFLKHRDKLAPSAASPLAAREPAAAVPSGSPDPSALPGAKRVPMPKDVDVTLATLSEKPFSDPNWLFEIKWDGERTVAFIHEGGVELRSRSHRSITHQFPELRRLPKDVRAMSAILDGEIVVLDADGRSNFGRLQNRFRDSEPSAALQASAPIVYYLFDVLYADGYDLRAVPLLDRKRFLAELLHASDRVRLSDHQIEKGRELYELARDRGLEGIVAKEIHSDYPGKRTRSWLKLKIVKELDAVIGGWTEPQKSRGSFGALLLGLYDGDELRYVGSVGTGFTQETLRTTLDKMKRVEAPKSPFHNPPKLKTIAGWTRPALVARIKYGELTGDRMLRQPVFIGFRDDVAPQDCRIETEIPAAAAARQRSEATPTPEAKSRARSNRPTREKAKARTPRRKSPTAAPSAADSASVAEQIESARTETLNIAIEGKNLRLTHLNKIYFPEAGYTKKDLLVYYARIAPHILPFLVGRAMVLRRYPDGIHGESFFQKEAPSPRPDWLETTHVFSEERHARMDYLLCNDLPALLFLTNLGCIDHNPWSSRADNEDHPDYVFFDLDPTPGTPFASVVKVALAIERHLRSAGVKPYLKTSGATGFHMFVPLEPVYTYEQVRTFAEAIGRLVAGELPSLVTSERMVKKRPNGRVLIDALQNSRGKPLASAYSVRPFPTAPVSTPITAAELDPKLRPEALNIKTVPQRVARQGDLWRDFFDRRYRLEDAVSRFLT
jgi:bifunctional non-homologous end joining protein LigD